MAITACVTCRGDIAMYNGKYAVAVEACEGVVVGLDVLVSRASEIEEGEAAVMEGVEGGGRSGREGNESSHPLLLTVSGDTASIRLLRSRVQLQVHV